MSLSPSKVTRDPNSLIKIDGYGTFKLFKIDGVATIQFCDHDRYRANCRGSRLMEMPLQDFIDRLYQLLPEDTQQS